MTPGYKQAEVGVIPEDWVTVAVADLVEPSAPICYGVVQVGQHNESGIPIVAIKFVKEISQAPLHRTAINLEKPYARSRPKAGDVLISIKGTIGRVGIVPIGFQGNISRELARLRIGSDTCSEYVAHQLEADATQERIMRSVVGTTRLELSIATLRQFQIPVPPTKKEQQAIAEALSDVDGLLGALDRLIAKKRDLKQAAMQQLLTGQTRLPGFHGTWEVKRFSEVVRHHAGNSTLIKGKLSASEAAGLFPAYSASGQDVWCSHFEHEGFAIVVSAVGSRCGKAFTASGKWSAIANTHVIWPNTAKVDARYLQLYLNDEDFWMKSGSGQPFVLFKQSLARTHRMPPFPEQTAIAQVLSDMDAELSALERRRDKTRAIKQGMMQELLTGRVRLV